MNRGGRTSCRLCEHDSTRPAFTVREFAVDRCTQCGFVQVRDEPTPDQIRALYSAQYFHHGKYVDDTAQRYENERRLALLAATGLNRSARVLDAGCATGDFLKFVGDRYDLWGLDVSEEAIELARRRMPERAGQLRAGFLEQMDFADASFDAIVMWDVLEHVFRPVEACRGLMRLLKPGGYLLLSTPDIGSLTARMMGTRWAFMTPPEHLGFFSSRSMTMLIQRRLGARLVRSFSRGKWANVGFLSYKLRRVFPAIPEAIVNSVRNSPIGSVSIYVPTGDIQYVMAQRTT